MNCGIQSTGPQKGARQIDWSSGLQILRGTKNVTGIISIIVSINSGFHKHQTFSALSERFTTRALRPKFKNIGFKQRIIINLPGASPMSRICPSRVIT